MVRFFIYDHESKRPVFNETDVLPFDSREEAVDYMNENGIEGDIKIIPVARKELKGKRSKAA